MVRAVDNLPKLAIVIAIRGAQEWLRSNRQEADECALYECCKSWARAKFPQAVKEAREAFDAGHADLALATFDASMIEAGVEAAKEAGWPIGFNAELACA
ncbi:MAG: hypothetical protein ABSG53_00170 [Thermoguttaceae bacterium]|jgi:hypothetical protein